ncbi:hypothetical protein ABPG74_012387 [Tetrahymena malaccensis]
MNKQQKRIRLNEFQNQISSELVTHQKLDIKIRNANLKEIVFSLLKDSLEKLNSLIELNLQLQKENSKEQMHQDCLYVSKLSLIISNLKDVSSLNIDLRNNQIKNEDISRLIISFENCQNITKLQLNFMGNDFNENDMINLFASLKKCQKLIELCLQVELDCFYDEKNTLVLGQGVENCSNLQILQLIIYFKILNREEIKQISPHPNIRGIVMQIENKSVTSLHLQLKNDDQFYQSYSKQSFSLNLKNMINLRNLSLQINKSGLNTKMVNQIGKQIENLANLENLNLDFSNNHIGYLTFDEIEKIKCKTSNKTCQINIPLTLISSLSKCQKLKKLDLDLKYNSLRWICENYGLGDFAKLFGELKHLTQFSIDLSFFRQRIKRSQKFKRTQPKFIRKHQFEHQTFSIWAQFVNKFGITQPRFIIRFTFQHKLCNISAIVLQETQILILEFTKYMLLQYRSQLKIKI